MIIFVAPGGRLGNQIFQLAFLLSIARPGERCLLSRMGGALRAFTHGLSVVQVPEGLPYKLFDKVAVPFLLVPLSRMRILSSFQEEAGTLTRRRGLFPGVRIVTGFFQSESFIRPGVTERLAFVPTLRADALRFVGSLQQGADPRNLVFVHVRRTDYLTHEILGKRDPSLPVSYYRKTIRWFLENLEHPYFVFVGDDPEFVRANFAWVADKSISENDPFTDLAIMTLCRGAILSNSTLAWWGARFIKRPVKVFAPRYWLGWKSARWYPEGIQPKFADCVDVG